MGIPVSSGKPAALPMNPGISQAVVVEVGPLVEQPNKFEPNKPPTRQSTVTFRDASGREAKRWYTPSFHDRATLAKDIKSVTGGQLPPAASFDLQSTWPHGLLGMQCQLLIGPAVPNARGYINAKIQAVMPPAPGQNIPVSTPPAVAASNVPPPNAAPGVYPVPPAQPQNAAVPNPNSPVGF